MGAYAVLTAIAFFFLHGKALYAILILFGGLALKTLIGIKRNPEIADGSTFHPGTPPPAMDSTSNR